MTAVLTVNIILAAIVFIAIVGMIARTIHVSSTLPEHRLGRLRTPREHAAARRRPAYRSLSTQA
jgi:hypothetical protein